ncbi:MAG: hypothetical protein M3Z09_02385 [Acidobacteriota bacterium]|nr:hypothetical protein [Acidobacteriota bacterium]
MEAEGAPLTRSLKLNLTRIPLNPKISADTGIVSSFLSDAEKIFEVARLGSEPEDFTIQLSAEGGIFVSPGGYGDSLPGISYRVRRSQGQVSVEGRTGNATCVLRSGAGILPRLADRPQYLLQSASR